MHKVSRILSIRFFIFRYLRFSASNKTIFLFQYNVQDQAEVTKQRNPRNDTDSNQSRRSCGFGYVSGACGDGCVRRRFHAGVFLTDPPVSVFADEGGQTVLTVRTDNLAEIDCIAVRIGENKLAVCIDLRFDNSDAVLTVFAVRAVNTVCSVPAVLSGVALIPFVSIIALISVLAVNAVFTVNSVFTGGPVFTGDVYKRQPLRRPPSR